MLTAKLVGDGYLKPNADKELPIDVNYAKVNEWLVDRKQVPADWNRKLQAIQAKAAEAVRELPPGFLAQFEGGGDVPLDYFMAQQVLDKLTETAEKSFLGSLKGAAGSWDKVVKAYEYNLVQVAEAAQTLCRNADFEIPFFKRQASKCQQQLADLERKKADAHKSAAAAAAEYRQECQQLGIDGGDIRGGLLGLTAELPALMGGAIEALQADAVTQGMQYYAALTSQQQGAAAAGGLLPVLEEVREGRTEAPAPAPAAAEPQDAAVGGSSSGGGGNDSSSTGLAAVDWDLGAALEAAGGEQQPGGNSPPTAAGISWDLDAADLASAAGGEAAPAAAGISWDIEADAAESAEAADADEAPAGGDGAPAEISWDIDISGVGEDTEQQEQPQQARGGSSAGGAAAMATDEPAAIRRLIEDAAYRAQLLDDLSELRAFLMQRIRELSGRTSELLAAAAASEVVQQVSADVASDMLQAVNAALELFGGDTLKQLIALRTSARYLDRLASGLHQKAGQEAKFHRAAADAEQRRGEIQRQLMTDAAKLAVLLNRTRQAKEEVERALTAKLGRRINIMGEVNQLL